MEQLDYNLLFRWFVGLSMDDEVWDASTFSKNRERMLEGDIAEAFFQGVLGEARAGQLLSDEHFTVDGTLLEAWASQKSFRPVDAVGKDKNDQEPKPPAARWDENNPTVNYRGEKRSNHTHCSSTDPEAMLARKGRGKEAKLSYHGHLMTENRNGLVVNTCLTTAYGSAEPHAGLLMAEPLPGRGRVTLGADKGYDQREFIEELRPMGITPHVAQNQRGRRSRVDQRTTRHSGYEISQRKRKRIEEVFGWMKTVGMLRQLRHRGAGASGLGVHFGGGNVQLSAHAHAQTEVCLKRAQQPEPPRFPVKSKQNPRPNALQNQQRREPNRVQSQFFSSLLDR